MSRAAPAPVIGLRTATVWGTTVLATRVLASGQSLNIGDGEGALGPKPDGTLIADQPIRAVGQGFELDARGATGGELWLRGSQENPAELGQRGAPLPIVPGDYGLIQYGSFSVFFQFTEAPTPLKKRRRIA